MQSHKLLVIFKTWSPLSLSPPLARITGLSHYCQPLNILESTHYTEFTEHIPLLTSGLTFCFILLDLSRENSNLTFRQEIVYRIV
jgi:hypothetical protein